MNSLNKQRAKTPVSLEEKTYKGISHNHFEDKKFSQVSKLIPYVESTEDNPNGLEGDVQNRIPIKSLRNGYYQEIFWLGCSGFMILNHHDKEILLVDPWSSYSSFWNSLAVPLQASDYRPLVPQDWELNDEILAPYYEDKFYSNKNPNLKRIEDLANCIRKYCNSDNGYKLTGILLSHMHYDHADDVPILLELLTKPAGTQYSYTGLIFNNLSDDPLSELPMICCDYDTRVYLQTHFWGRKLSDIPIEDTAKYWKGKEIQEDHLGEGYFYLCEKKDHSDKDPKFEDAWNNISTTYGLTDDKFLFITANSVEVAYDDTYINEILGQNNSPAPGIELLISESKNPSNNPDRYTLGSFLIRPYLWDHMNTGPGKKWNSALDDQKSGHCQRMSAFLIQRKSLSTAKKTLIIGSAGGMSNTWTEPQPINRDDIPKDKNDINSWDNRNKFKIETDVLLQAINGRVNALADQSDEVRDGWKYINKNIIIKDFIAFSHWEDFVMRQATTEIFKSEKNFKLVRANVDMVKARLKGENKNVVENDGVFIMGRCGNDYENAFPSPNSAYSIPLNIHMEVDTELNSDEKPTFTIGSTSNLDEPFKSFTEIAQDHKNENIKQSQKTFSAKLSNTDISNLGGSLLKLQSKKKHVIIEGEEEWFGEDYKNIVYDNKPFATEELLTNIHIFVGDRSTTGSSKSFDELAKDHESIRPGINTILIRLSEDKSEITDQIIDGTVYIKDSVQIIKNIF